MGNRFGGNYNSGEDSLFRMQLRNALISRFQNRNGGSGQVNSLPGAARGAGYTVRPTEMITATQPTAQESHAFNELVRDRALYGRYGKGGVERERIRSSILSEAARRNLTPKDRADIIQKNRELDIKAAEAGLPVSGGAGTQNILGGEALGAPPAGGEPNVRDVARIRGTRPSGGGRIVVPEGAPNAGTYEIPGAYGATAGRGVQAGTREPAAPVADRNQAALRDLAREFAASVREGAPQSAPAQPPASRPPLRYVPHPQLQERPAGGNVDWWGSGQPRGGARNIWDDIADYLGYAKAHAY